MSYQIAAGAKAIAAVLGGIDGVQVHDAPPTSINPPALVVSYPDAIAVGTRALGVDTATVSIICAVGLSAPLGQLDDLVNAARAALDADRTLGGAVMTVRISEIRNIRSAQAAGIDVLAADLVVEVDK